MSLRVSSAQREGCNLPCCQAQLASHAQLAWLDYPHWITTLILGDVFKEVELNAELGPSLVRGTRLRQVILSASHIVFLLSYVAPSERRYWYLLFWVGMLFCLSVPTCGGVGEALLTLVDAVDDNLNTGTRMQRSLLLNGME
jgi:hypothetical protein